MAYPPLANRIWTLVKHTQFIWWFGHCIVSFSTFFCIYYWVIRRFDEGASYYYTAYLGSILSYSVVIYKLYGRPELTSAYYRKINKDENVYYLMLAILWFINAPVWVTLFPYATFSLFHLVTYFRGYILPTFFPQHNQPTNSYEQWANTVSKFLQEWVDKHYDQAMRTVSFFEVVIITVILSWSIVTFHIRFFTIFVYLHFLRMRFHMNLFTQQAFVNLGVRLDYYFLPPTAKHTIPSTVSDLYRHAKSAVIWFGRPQLQQYGRFQPQAGQSSERNASAR